MSMYGFMLHWAVSWCIQFKIRNIMLCVCLILQINLYLSTLCVLKGDFCFCDAPFLPYLIVRIWAMYHDLPPSHCCVPYAYFIPYAYGTYHTRICIWYDRTRMVWLFVPYAYGYYIAIANTVLLFTINHELYPWCSFLFYSDVNFVRTHSDKLVISRWIILTLKVTLN